MDAPKNNEWRKNWRLNWLGSLANLADIELQQRWLDRRITNPAWSYIEFMCKDFDGLGCSDDGYKEKIRSGFVTQDEHDCIRDFHRALDDYKAPNGDYDALAILDDPVWQKIVTAGHRSIVKLEKLITEPEEKAALLEKPALTFGDFTWPK